MRPFGVYDLTNHQGVQGTLMVEHRTQLNNHNVNENTCDIYNEIVTLGSRVVEVRTVLVSEYLISMVCYREGQ